MGAVELIHVDKRFGEKVIFSDFSHAFEMGRVHAIVGASGGGKTTLLRLIAGLTPPDRGDIRGAMPRDIAMVFQEDRLSEPATAVDNVSAVLPRTGGRLRAVAALAALGLAADAYTPVFEMSGGMKRRVALARAIAVDRPILLMDEPFKGLDADTRAQAVAYVKAQTRGKTLLMVTHDPQDGLDLDAEFFEL